MVLKASEVEEPGLQRYTCLDSDDQKTAVIAIL
jgi:hypothetical protein